MTRILIYLLLLGMLVAYKPLPDYPISPPHSVGSTTKVAEATSAFESSHPGCTFHPDNSIRWNQNTVILWGSFTCDSTATHPAFQAAIHSQTPTDTRTHSSLSSE